MLLEGLLKAQGVCRVQHSGLPGNSKQRERGGAKRAALWGKIEAQSRKTGKKVEEEEGREERKWRQGSPGKRTMLAWGSTVRDQRTELASGLQAHEGGTLRRCILLKT